MDNASIKSMVKNQIENEIRMFEQGNGIKFKSKALFKGKMLYTLILVLAILLVFAVPPMGVITLVVYITLMVKTTNVSIITSLAKKSPDTPVAYIIKGDMR